MGSYGKLTDDVNCDDEGKLWGVMISYIVECTSQCSSEEMLRITSFIFLGKEANIQKM
jgi:hypothetical protein